MDLSKLSIKQKRLRDWTQFLETEEFDGSIRNETEATLKAYKAAILRCWEKEEVTDEDNLHLEDLERQLEELNEQLRFRARPS